MGQLNYTNRVTTHEAKIMEEAERHSARLGKTAIGASNASWKHDDLMREARHASGAPKQDALARLAALNASYGDVPADIPRPNSGLRSIASHMAGGAAMVLVLFTLAPATHRAALDQQAIRADVTRATINRASFLGQLEAEAHLQARDVQACARPTTGLILDLTWPCAAPGR